MALADHEFEGQNAPPLACVHSGWFRRDGCCFYHLGQIAWVDEIRPLFSAKVVRQRTRPPDPFRNFEAVFLAIDCVSEGNDTVDDGQILAPPWQHPMTSPKVNDLQSRQRRQHPPSAARG